MDAEALAPEHRTEPAPPAGPITAEERITAIDTLRGFAIFGILLVNMGSFRRPEVSMLLESIRDLPWPDRAVEWLVAMLAESKFYTLFSFLFGLGMAIQMERAAARGAGFVALYVRRLLVLLALGLAHTLLFWFGDVLTVYALLGFPLLLLRRRSDRLVLILALAVYCIPMVLIAGRWALYEIDKQLPDLHLVQYEEDWEEGARVREAEALERYGAGSFHDALAQRWADHEELLDSYVLYWMPQIFTMFLLGLVAGRHRILHEPQRHRSWFWTLLLFALPFGLACNVLYTWLIDLAGRMYLTERYFVAYYLHWLGVPALSFGYAAAIVLLVQNALWRRLLSSLAAVGRMALTNYLMQTLICTTLFYGYGFGWFGKVSAAEGLGLAVLIYAVQVPLSVLWLQHFRFGPLEWLWRSLTYLRVQPMRKPRPRGLPPPTQGIMPWD